MDPPPPRNRFFQSLWVFRPWPIPACMPACLSLFQVSCKAAMVDFTIASYSTFFVGCHGSSGSHWMGRSAMHANSTVYLVCGGSANGNIFPIHGGCSTFPEFNSALCMCPEHHFYAPTCFNSSKCSRTNKTSGFAVSAMRAFNRRCSRCPCPDPLRK